MTRIPEVRIFQELQDLADEAADFFVWLGEQAITQRGRFLVVLSGGTTPQALYAVLSAEYANRLDWNRVQFFFGDERCVPPSHPDSNFTKVDISLFRPLKISAAHIHRMKGEEDPETAAEEYEGTIRTLLNVSDDHVPTFDLILLGLGEDGHTASLFPRTPTIDERTRWVVPGTSPTGIRARLTMTLPVINRAAVVLFLVAGQNKAPVAHRILEPTAEKTVTYPAALVQPENGRLLWFLDRPAASELAVSIQNMSSREE